MSGAMSPTATNFQPPPGLYPYDLTYKFNASMAIIVVVLVTTFFFMALFVLYIRRCNINTSGGWPAMNQEHQQQNQQQRIHHGLDPEILEKLPIMRYASIKSAKKGKAGPECAVCLLQFEESEQVRLLPECGHMFHAECIDMWLETHSTCPLCRRSLDQQNAAPGHLQRALSAVMSSFRRDPNSPSIGEGRDPAAQGGSESREPDLEAGNLDAEVEAAANASSRRHQGDVVRTLSRHSESFKIAVHDMDLIEVREKMLRAKSLRAPNPPPPPSTAATAASKNLHHSQSFAGLFPLQDHHEDEPSSEKEEGTTGLRRSVSDGKSLSKRDSARWIDDGEASSNNTVRDRDAVTGNRAMFSGFARRSLKWLGIKDSTVATATDSDASQQDSLATTKTERSKV